MYCKKLLGAVLCSIVLTFSAFAQVAPTFTKGFFQGQGPTPQLTVPADGTTPATLRFTITNINPGAALIDIAFTDTLPAGLQVAPDPMIVGTCGAGVVPTAVAGSNTISLTGGMLGSAGFNPPANPGSSCSFVVNVVGIVPGVQNNQTSAITATATLGLAAPVPLTGPAATASITVLGPPTITKAFSPPLVAVGNSTTLTFTISNPNAAAINTVSFFDQFPSGLVIAANPALTNTCGGTPGSVLVATAGTNIVNLANSKIAANSSCTVSLQVTGTLPGVFTNITSTVGSGDTPPGGVATATVTVIPADAYQVRYGSNLAAGDSVINITNAGSSLPRPPVILTGINTLQPQGPAVPASNGNICVNAYAFSPDEQLISCCSCLITPNALESLSARGDLISNTLTPAVPTSIVVKLLASSVTTVGTTQTCNPSTVTPASIALAGGLAAWGTSLHALPVTPGSPSGTFGITETPFVRSTLSPAELARLTGLCGFIQTDGSGFGICKSCRLGGLGGEKQ